MADFMNDFGKRLLRARKMAGFSLQDLADASGVKISKQALSKYEHGLMKPSAELLSSIATALSVSEDYFIRENTAEFSRIEFRKRARLSKKAEESILEKVRLFVEKQYEIENILGITRSFENPLSELEISSWNDVGKAAEKLRAYWELGTDPILSVVQTLETRGVKVFLSQEVDDFDGLALYTQDDIPVVVVNIADRPIERIRFTLVHELAHLLLNFDSAITEQKNAVEKYCHFFASNFLLPSSKIMLLLGKKRSYIRLDELISIKETFGISIRAIVYRLQQIGIITEDYRTRWVVYLSKTFGNKEEPGEFKSREMIRYFHHLVNRALSEGFISIGKAAELWGVSIHAIRKGFAGN